MTIGSITDFIETCSRKVNKGHELSPEEIQILKEIQKAFLTGGFCKNSYWPLTVTNLLSNL